MENRKINLPQYEFTKQANKRIQCDKCEHIWDAKDTVIHNEVVKNENGQEMLVHFFLCLKCKEVYVVDIIDSHMRVCLERISKLEKKIARAQKRKVNVSEEVSRRNQIREQMLSYQKALKDKYSKYLHLKFEEANH